MQVVFLLLFSLIIIPFSATAQVVINEIMYDLEGSDSGREWIEIFNSGNEPVDLAGWKIYEAETNHKINLFNESGNFIIPAGGYAIIADDPNKFLADWPDFSGVVFDSVFSLHNTGENIILRDSDLNDIDEVFYNSEWGANGEGNSLQKISENWKAAVPTPGSQNASQKTEEQEQQNSNQQQNQTQNQTQNYGTPSPVVERIKAYAGEDKLGVAGADIEFIGKAWGLKDEPLDSARFIWNFGDGSFKEGKAVRHNYSFPGEYVVVLDVSSGEYSASHVINVKIIPNEVVISEINPFDSWVELYNGSDKLIDISFWRLSNGKKIFTFPKNTFIKAESYIVISQSASSLVLNDEKGEVKFLYPNGSVADEFSYQGKIKETESFSRLNGEIIVSIKTPAEKNVVIQQSSEAGPATLAEQKKTADSPQPEINKQTFLDDMEKQQKAPNTDLSVGTGNIVLNNKNNEANVLEDAQNFSKTGKWLLIILGISIFSGTGFWVLRKSV